MHKSELKQGIKAALPVIFGYFPVGLAFGVLAVQAGMSVAEVFMMSLLVYAGSSQFIAAGMLATQASIGAIILTTFLVNSRHLLMTASLAPFVKNIKAKLLSILGFWVTDETYAISIAAVAKEEKSQWYFWGLFLTAHLAWISSTVLGAMAGNFIPDPQRFGLDFALPAMFVALLILQVKHKKVIAIGLVAAFLSIAIKLNIPGSWNIILATLISATLGVMIDKWMQKSFSSSSA
ncbi:AzlC family ABC transporter permease [Desulforamulus aquiferis]|uniref:AzlC family ABC transporter permease n=1 Tax=Desulforamulus aquiferis TaxID=1397668 RepID=A0AAW7ZAM2_9FIRM|nr:AzlC family ABC transporter permease [Desulforamulus aquiferis]MDO7786279.1 AzlC family ABC transporter permease [Desulforamulus aquiferis]RYD01813.1 branched-chain amino acid permease [Desulforamulus aquiferis]